MFLRSLFIALLIAASLTLTACDSPEEKAAHYIERGDSLFKQEDYVKAKLEYKNAARLIPTNAEIFYKLALTDEAQGDFQNAFSGFIAAEQQDANYQLALIKLAQYFLASRNYADATKRLDHLLKANPDNIEAHALRAMLSFRLNKYDEAEKEANIVLEKDAANVKALNTLAAIFETRGDNEKALATINTAIEKNPQEITPLFSKIVLLKKKNDSEGIIKTYEKIFALRPAEFGHRISLAALLAQNKKLVEAERILRDGIVALPDSEELKQTLVSFLNETKGLQATEQEILGFIKDNPKEKKYSFWLAELYALHAKKDEAKNVLQRLIDDKDDEDNVLLAKTALARLSYFEHNKDQTRTIVNEILKKKPSHEDALYLRARMASDEKNYESSTLDLRQILRDNPKNSEAADLLIKNFLEQGRFTLALDTADNLAAALPNDLPTQIKLAQLWSYAGDPKRGLELLTKMVTVAPETPALWLNIFSLAVSSKSWEEADKALIIIEKLAPPNAKTNLLRAELALAKGDKDAALAFLKETDPADNQATFIKANIKVAQRKTQEAIGLYETILERDPNIEAAANNLALLLADSKADDPASLEKALKLTEPFATSSNPAFLDTLAWVYYRQGKIDDSYKTIQNAVRFSPSLPPQASYHLGIILMKKGETEKAKEALNKAIQGDKDYEGFEEAQKALQQIR